MGNFDILTEYLRECRRELHKIPELSNQEVDTQAYLCARLKELRLRPRTIKTGIVVDVAGTEKKKAFVALRCDMDALPIAEKNQTDYISTRAGRMHACGHDGHMAMMLGVAKVLSQAKPRYNTRLIFQPAEEGCGGAEMMIEQGALEGVGEIYGLHLSPEIEKGVLAGDKGALFAGAVEFDIAFYGERGHCADAVKKDAIAAASLYHRLIAERMTSFKGALMHLGKISGGDARNVVASEVLCEYTLRYFSAQDKEAITLLIASTLNEVDDICKTEHRVTVHTVYPPLVNSIAAYTVATEKNKIQTCEAKYTAEDFAFYCQKVHGFFAWLGVRDENHSSPLHSDTFDFDESVLVRGVEYFCSLIGADITNN